MTEQDLLQKVTRISGEMKEHLNMASAYLSQTKSIPEPVMFNLLESITALARVRDKYLFDRSNPNFVEEPVVNRHENIRVDYGNDD